MSLLEDEFGDIIQKARTGRGLSVGDLAQQSGVSAEAIAAFESYARQPESAAVDRLAAALGLDAASLWQIASGNYVPAPVSPDLDGGLSVRTFTFAGAASHGYVILAPGAALLVDPGGSASRLLAAVSEGGRQLAAILITHGHGDHVGALEPVARAAGCQVYAHPAERLGNLVPGEKLRPVTSDEPFTVAGVRVEPLLCPGHTPGHVAFAVGAGLFIGDTLFAGSLGRAPSPALYTSLLASARRLLVHPPQTKLFPGHGPATTVAEQRRYNPFAAELAGAQGAPDRGSQG